MSPEDDFAELMFTFGHCTTCDRRVLTYPDVEADSGHLHCVHCDAVVGVELEAAPGGDLPEHGYGLLELQGCGSPDCGGGRCGRMDSEEQPG